MNKIVIGAASIVLALVPAAAAHAGDTGNGKAWGNCRNSSAGGVLAPVMPSEHGRGNGGLQSVAKSGAACAPTDAPVERPTDLGVSLPTPDQPAPVTPPAPGDTISWDQ